MDEFHNNRARKEFGLDADGNEVDTDDPVERAILAIPTDTPKDKLPKALRGVIEALSNPEHLESAIDGYMAALKDRFGLPEKSITSIRKDIKRRRRERARSENGADQSPDDTMDALRREKDRCVINPAQDFVDGKGYFTIHINDKPYLFTSDREIIPFEDTPKFGLKLTEDHVDTARMSPQAVIDHCNSESCDAIAEVYQKILAYLTRYVFFKDDRLPRFLTLWTMGTYMFRLFDYYPYVSVNAEKGSGKSLLMRVLADIAFNGQVITNPTEAVIFRDVAANAPTLFIDEAEQLRRQDKEAHGALIGLLNSGFQRGAIVKRNEATGKGSFRLRLFGTYSPKMFAGINELDDVLFDRTIPIRLLRKKENESVKRFQHTKALREEQQAIRDSLYRATLELADSLSETVNRDEYIPEGAEHLANRELDLWQPVFVIANLVDGGGEGAVSESMTALSKDVMAERHEINLRENETHRLVSEVVPIIEELPPIATENGTCYYQADKVFELLRATEAFGFLEKYSISWLTRKLHSKTPIKKTEKRIAGRKLGVYAVPPDFDDFCERYTAGGNGSAGKLEAQNDEPALPF